jgi:hypothetical protein
MIKSFVLRNTYLRPRGKPLNSGAGKYTERHFAG